MESWPFYPCVKKPAAPSLAVKVRTFDFSCAIKYLFEWAGFGLLSHQRRTSGTSGLNVCCLPEVAQPVK